MKILSVLAIVCFLANLQPLIGCSCFAVTNATVANSLLTDILKTTQNVVVGRTVRYSIASTPNTMCSRTFLIQFEVEKTIRGNIREKTVLTFIEDYGTCVPNSSCLRFTLGTLNGDQYTLDTNRQILFLGDTPNYTVNFNPCFETSGRWTMERERWIDSLNKVLVSTSLEENKEGSIFPQVYPNPCNEHSIIQYNLRQASHVAIDIINMKGDVVQTVVNVDVLPAGNHKQQLNVDTFSNGVYFCRVRTMEGINIIRIIINK